MGQKFKLHTLKFSQCPAPTRRAVTQSAGGAAVTKIQKAPLSPSSGAGAGQKCPGSVRRLDIYVCGVTGYASHSSHMWS